VGSVVAHAYSKLFYKGVRMKILQSGEYEQHVVCRPMASMPDKFWLEFYSIWRESKEPDTQRRLHSCVLDAQGLAQLKSELAMMSAD